MATLVEEFPRRVERVTIYDSRPWKNPLVYVVAVAAILMIVLIMYSFRNIASSSGFTPGELSSDDGMFVDAGATTVGECKPLRAASAPCHERPSKGSGDRLCPLVDCRKCPPKKHVKSPPEPPCVAPPMPPIVRDPCYRPDKARGEALCPLDLCRNWCWDPVTVEEAQGLASAGAIGFDHSPLGSGDLEAVLGAP